MPGLPGHVAAEDRSSSNLLTIFLVHGPNLATITAKEDYVVIELGPVCGSGELRAGYSVQWMEWRDVVHAAEQLVGNPCRRENETDDCGAAAGRNGIKHDLDGLECLSFVVEQSNGAVCAAR